MTLAVNRKILIVTLIILLVVTSGLVFFLVSKQPAPPNTDNLFLLADYYFNHGPDADGTYDLSLARKYYELGLTASPRSDNWAWYQAGRIDFLEGRFAEALYKFDKQIQYFNDDLPSVYYMIGLTYGYRARRGGSAEDWQMAEKNFRKYLELDENSPWARTDLTWIYFAQGKYAEMIEPLEIGLEINPANPWLLNMYGLALLNTDRKEEALSAFLQAKAEASNLTAKEWGRSYPGNNPSSWSRGLSEFQLAIQNNIELAELTTGH